MPGIDVASLFLPAIAGYEVGGDFYDVFELDDGRWVALVGDVCGKGLEAAALTGLARHTLRAVANVKRPSEALDELNRALLRERIDGRFCTVAIAMLEPPEGHGARVTVAVGGHPLPQHVSRTGAATSVGRHGTLLGVAEKVALQDDTVILEPGEALVLFTDGIIGKREAAEGSVALRSALADRDAGIGGRPARSDRAVRSGRDGRRSARRRRRVGADGALSSLYDAHLRSRTVVPARASVPRCSEKSSTIAAIRYIPRWEPGSPSTTGRVMR